MRVVFMGTPAFAVPTFEMLVARHDVLLAVTMPDRASGRGRQPRPSAVKEAALLAGVPVLQPSTLKGETTETIRHLGPDVICVVAFGMLLPPELLAVPAHGCLNVHASLLPRFRGAAPIQRAILEGEPVTGVSIMRMETGLDTGPYARQERIDIDDLYADELESVLARVGAEALAVTLAAIEEASVVWTSQDDAAATYASKITKDDVALLPELSTAEAFSRVRASTRRAPARACVGERELTVVRARPLAEVTMPGAVCLVDGVPLLGFADGSLALDVVRPAGKSDMAGGDWARGAHLDPDTCWRCTR